jgi:hypothetical protein
LWQQLYPSHVAVRNGAINASNASRPEEVAFGYLSAYLLHKLNRCNDQDSLPLDKQRLARLMHKPQVRTQWRGTETEHRLHPLDGILDDSIGAAR